MILSGSESMKESYRCGFILEGTKVDWTTKKLKNWGQAGEAQVGSDLGGPILTRGFGRFCFPEITRMVGRVDKAQKRCF